MISIIKSILQTSALQKARPWFLFTSWRKPRIIRPARVLALLWLQHTYFRPFRKTLFICLPPKRQCAARSRVRLLNNEALNSRKKLRKERTNESDFQHSTDPYAWRIEPALMFYAEVFLTHTPVYNMGSESNRDIVVHRLYTMCLGCESCLSRYACRSSCRTRRPCACACAVPLVRAGCGCAGTPPRVA